MERTACVRAARAIGQLNGQKQSAASGVSMDVCALQAKRCRAIGGLAIGHHLLRQLL